MSASLPASTPLSSEAAVTVASLEIQQVSGGLVADGELASERQRARGARHHDVGVAAGQHAGVDDVAVTWRRRRWTGSRRPDRQRPRFQIGRARCSCREIATEPTPDKSRRDIQGFRRDAASRFDIQRPAAVCADRQTAKDLQIGSVSSNVHRRPVAVEEAATVTSEETKASPPARPSRSGPTVADDDAAIALDRCVRPTDDPRSGATRAGAQVETTGEHGLPVILDCQVGRAAVADR